MRSWPLLFLLVCSAAAAYVGFRFRPRGNLGPQCDLKEEFATVGRPAYSHHCVCWGLKYNENPQPAPNAGATRCFGFVRKSWLDVDELALKMIVERERVAKNEKFFAALPPEAQARVKAAYKRLREGIYRNDYPYMLEQAKAILLEVDDYGETKAFQTMAREALEKQRARAAAPSP